MTEHAASGTGPLTQPARWSRVVVAVLVAGTVPAVLINLLVLYHLDRAGTRLADFLLHLLPLVLGAWAVTAWAGRRPRLVVVLAVVAGAIEVLVMVAIFSKHGHVFLSSVFGSYTVPAVEDYLAVPATIALFTAGALMAERTRAPRAAGARRPSGPGSALWTAGRASDTAPSGLTAVLMHPATMPLVALLGLALQALSAFGAGGHG